jgi:hypothetical protein
MIAFTNSGQNKLSTARYRKLMHESVTWSIDVVSRAHLSPCYFVVELKNAIKCPRATCKHVSSRVRAAQTSTVPPSLDSTILEPGHLLIGKADVQSALVRVDSSILHWQNPRVFCALVVMAMPPARRRNEHGS